jgi:hypothetical protein
MTQPIDFIGRLAATQNGDARYTSPLLAQSDIARTSAVCPLSEARADINDRVAPTASLVNEPKRI